MHEVSQEDGRLWACTACQVYCPLAAPEVLLGRFKQEHSACECVSYYYYAGHGNCEEEVQPGLCFVSWAVALFPTAKAAFSPVEMLAAVGVE